MRRSLLLVVVLWGCGSGEARLRPVAVPDTLDPEPVAADAGDVAVADAGPGLVETGPVDAGTDAGVEPEPADAGRPTFPLTERQTVAAGAMFSCALAQGQVFCWGKNDVGQCGDAAGADHPVPTRVLPIADAIEVSAGQNHACALTSVGQVWCWGGNELGQLGRGTQALTGAPTLVPGLSGVQSIAVGSQGHNCALRTTGQLWCWGRGLGNTGTGSASPLSVAGLGTVSAVSVGDHQVCAVLAQGALWCWGGNFAGGLGDGTTVERQTPAKVPALPPVTQVSSGNGYVCAVTGGGQVWCWGRGESGQLGVATPAAQLTPQLFAGVAADRVATSGGLHTCARVPSGAVQCWGSNAVGQLGNGQSGLNPELTPVATDVIDGIDLSAGAFHTCARRASGTIACWGINSNGQLGNGQSGTLSMKSVQVIGLP